MKQDLIRELRRHAVQIGLLIGAVIGGLLVAVLGGGKY